jgi:hypothetical protein
MDDAMDEARVGERVVEGLVKAVIVVVVSNLGIQVMGLSFKDVEGCGDSPVNNHSLYN